MFYVNVSKKNVRVEFQYNWYTRVDGKFDDHIYAESAPMGNCLYNSLEEMIHNHHNHSVVIDRELTDMIIKQIAQTYPNLRILFYEYDLVPTLSTWSDENGDLIIRIFLDDMQSASKKRPKKFQSITDAPPELFEKFVLGL